MKRNWKHHYSVFAATALLFLAAGVNVALERLVFVAPYLTGPYAASWNAINANYLLIAPFAAAVLCVLLFWSSVRGFLADYPYQKFHYSRKWTKAYVAGTAAFASAVLLNLVFAVAGCVYFTTGYKGVIDQARQTTAGMVVQDPVKMILPFANVLEALLWAAFGLVAAVSIAAVGLIKYALFQIDLELLRRRNAKEGEPAPADADDRPVRVDLGKQTLAERDKSGRDVAADGQDPPQIASAGL